ncbi:serine threonine kinase domain protein [Rutstroemia sp. NJR-2017a BBW]|nr:serine threonine kinase domain protein [Rutstroemia sp. NJR-2017a BBW]
MEDDEQVSRRSRIPSTTRMQIHTGGSTTSSNNYTRMTPTLSSTSSNGSSGHLPLHSGSNNAQSGGASLLQERLRERRGRDMRMSADLGRDVDLRREIHSSPSRGSKIGRDERRPSSSGVSQPIKKPMGVKQMEEVSFYLTVSKYHKENFDLKLELFHRRERQAALESELEHVKDQIFDQKEMQEMNDQLIAELEKRDEALDEAVGWICNLDMQVDDLKAQIRQLVQDRENVRSFDMQYERAYFTQELEKEMPSSPPIYESSSFPRRKENSIARMPSFLSEKSEGVEALRSLYLPSSHSVSDVGLPRLPEEARSSNGMASPSLSVLSESSFISIYGEKAQPASIEDFDTPSRHRRTNLSVEKWMDGRPASTLPMHAASPASQGSRSNKYLSMNYVAASPLQRLARMQKNLEKGYQRKPGMRLASDPIGSTMQDKFQPQESLRRVTVNMSGFESSQKLPPTPDTFSTGTLRTSKDSNDTLDYKRQINDDDVTLLHSTSSISTSSAFQHPYSPSKPRSAVETVTSHRDSHGWETETQDDMTDTFSNNSITSSNTFEPRTHLRPLQSQAQAPEFFSFTMEDRHPRGKPWGGDTLFSSYPATRLPTGYPSLKDPAASQPNSDDTVTAASSTYRRPNSRAERSSNLVPLDDTARPAAPNRRSSLAAKGKSRTPTIPASPVSTSTIEEREGETGNEGGKDKKKEAARSSSSNGGGGGKDFRNLLPSRIFSRSDTAPVMGRYDRIRDGESRKLGDHQFDGSLQGHEEGGTGVGISEDGKTEREKNVVGGGTESEFNRATPPPIPRSRSRAGAQSQQGWRSNSVGTGAGLGLLRRGGSMREKSASGRLAVRFGGDGVDDCAVEDCAVEDEGEGEGGVGVVGDCIAGDEKGKENGKGKGSVKGWGMGLGMGKGRKRSGSVDVVRLKNEAEEARLVEGGKGGAVLGIRQGSGGAGRKWFGGRVGKGGGERKGV